MYPCIFSPGSAGSLAKSMRSDIGESGSESGMDGDNINVVIRLAGVMIMIMVEYHGVYLG